MISIDRLAMPKDKVNSFYSNIVEIFRKINQIFMRHPIISSAIYNTLILVFVCIVGDLAWEGADDFTISQLLMGSPGETTPFVLGSFNYYMASMIIWIGELLPIVNWLSALEVLAVWLTFTVMVSYLISKNKRGMWGFVLSMLFALIFAPCFYLSLQYTRAAFLYSFTGAWLILNGVCFSDDSWDKFGDSKAGHKVLRISGVICGCALFVIGAIFRDLCFFISTAFAGILFFDKFVKDVKDKHIRENSKTYVILSIIVIMLFCCIYGLEMGSAVKWEQFNRDNTWTEYNKARSDLTDYMPKEYQESISTEEFPISENDYLMLRYSMISDNYFSKNYYDQVTDRLQQFKEYKVFSVSDFVQQLLHYSNSKRQNQYSLFLVWALFSIAGILSMRRNNRVVIFSNLIGTAAIAVYFIAVVFRFSSWVEDSVYMISCFIYIVGVVTYEDMEIGESNILTRRKEYTRFGRIKANAIILLIMFCSLVGRTISFKHELAQNHGRNPELMALMEYAVADKEHFYVLDNINSAPYPYIDLYGPLRFFEKGEWSNIYRVGNWDVGHPVRNAQKDVYGIESVISSMLTSDIRLVTLKECYSLEVYRNFFREHYNSDYELFVEAEFGNYIICTFVPKVLEEESLK